MIPGDISPVAAATPDRLAGIVLCTPFFLDPVPFAQLADRVLLVSGEYGSKPNNTLRGLASLPVEIQPA
jgi:hypothetical protein